MKREKLLRAIGQVDDQLIADAQPEVRARQKRIRMQWFVALAACLLLIFCAGIITPLALGNREAGVLTMEVNPCVEFTITRNGKVKSARFLNGDAQDALEEVAFKGQSINDAVMLAIAAYKTGGYMEKNDTVLISFDKKLSQNDKLKESVTQTVSKALEKTSLVHTVVYVPFEDNAAAAELAAKHNISQGKAQLVCDAAKINDLPTEDLVDMPLDQLVGLQDQDKVDSSILSSKYIGFLKAKQIALDDAGCANRVVFTESLLITEKTLTTSSVQVPYYRLVFNDGKTQWTYCIDAKNGTILEKNKVELFISLQEAKEIVLKDSGLYDSPVAEKVIFTKEELSRNQGKPCWVLEFYTEKFQYSYKVDAITGEIIFFDYHIDIEKAKLIALTDAGCLENGAARITFTVEEYVGGGIKTPYFYFVFNDTQTQWAYRIDAVLGIVLEKHKEVFFITLEKAKEIALKDANLSDSDEVVFTLEVLSRNMGRPCWVLEFYTEKYQYCYKVDVKTGEIIYLSRYINIKVAKEIALEDSGCLSTNVDRIIFTVEELVDGGIKTPYYLFVFNNGTTQWEYRIDATSGAILNKNVSTFFIPLEKAKEIALKDAQIDSEEIVTFTKEILSRNAGRPCWVLEFYTEKYQYCYKVDAKTGEIIYARRYINIKVAKEIAVNDAGCSDIGKVVFKQEELIDGGIKTPYYLFVFNDGQTQWMYRINAITGGILEKMQVSIKSVE